MFRLFKKSRLLSHKQLQRKRRRFFVKVFVLLFVLVLIVVGISYVLRLPALTIATVKVTGDKSSLANDIVTTANNELAGQYLGLFSKKNIFIFPKDELQAEILKLSPKIAAVTMAVGNDNVLAVNPIERKPRALWCDGSFSSTTNCYYLDTAGKIFDPAPSFSGTGFFTYFGGGLSTNPLGSSYLTSSLFSDLDQFRQHVIDRGIPVVALTTVADNEFTLTLQNATGTGQILINTATPYDTVLENLTTIWNEEIKPSAKAPARAVDYIDLRYGNKVYFKVR